MDEGGTNNVRETSRWNYPTNVPACSMVRMICDPITTPSEYIPTDSKWSRVETPKPTASGSAVNLRRRWIIWGRDWLTVARTPVTPSELTTYTKLSPA